MKAELERADRIIMAQAGLAPPILLSRKERRAQVCGLKKIRKAIIKRIAAGSP